MLYSVVAVGIVGGGGGKKGGVNPNCLLFSQREREGERQREREKMSR